MRFALVCTSTQERVFAEFPSLRDAVRTGLLMLKHAQPGVSIIVEPAEHEPSFMSMDELLADASIEIPNLRAAEEVGADYEYDPDNEKRRSSPLVIPYFG